MMILLLPDAANPARTSAILAATATTTHACRRPAPPLLLVQLIDLSYRRYCYWSCLCFYYFLCYYVTASVAVTASIYRHCLSPLLLLLGGSLLRRRREKGCLWIACLDHVNPRQGFLEGPGVLHTKKNAGPQLHLGNPWMGVRFEGQFCVRVTKCQQLFGSP